MTTKNFKVKNGISIGDDITINEDGGINGLTTDNLNEGGGNRYYLDTRAREAISVTDTGGDGSLSYDNTEGIFTYTGPSASEVRAHFTGGTGVTITDGSIAIGQAVGTADDVQFDQVTATNLVTSAIAPASGNLTLTTTSTGNILLTTADGGNVVTSRNFVDGAIRNANTQARGNIWELLATTPPTAPTQAFTGISVDNSGVETTKLAGAVLRNYGSLGPQRPRLIFERARGTAAAPARVQLGDLLGEVDATGYFDNLAGTAGWINDTLALVPAFYGFVAAETWTSTSNLGTNFIIALQPTGTLLAAGSQIPVVAANPQNLALRSDAMTMYQGKTASATITASISGTTMTVTAVATGTLTPGQFLTNAASTVAGNMYIVSQLSGTTGGTGTYQVSRPQTLGSGTITAHKGFLQLDTALSFISSDTIRLQSSTGSQMLTSTTTEATLTPELTIANANTTRGGAGYASMMALTNQTAGATNPNKYIRLNSTGDLEIVNSAYTATIFSLSDSGNLTVPGRLSYDRVYGEFCNTATMTAGAINTIYAMTYDTTNMASDVSVVSNSRITIAKAGQYKIIMSLQTAMETNSVGSLDFWLRKNGTDVANSATQVDLLKDQKAVIAMDWMVDAAANDYYEIVYAVDDVNLDMPAYAALTTPYVRPAVPSVIVNVIPVGA